MKLKMNMHFAALATVFAGLQASLFNAARAVNGFSNATKQRAGSKARKQRRRARAHKLNETNPRFKPYIDDRDLPHGVPGAKLIRKAAKRRIAVCWPR